MYGFFEPLGFDVIQSQRQQNRKRKAGDESVDADGQRISEQSPKFVGIKETLEMVEADPWTSEHAFGDSELLKRDNVSKHRYVFEYDDVKKR